MLRLLNATAICGTLLLSITPASAARFGCNPAIQNWENGSKDTCPYNSPASAVVIEQKQESVIDTRVTSVDDSDDSVD